MSSDDVWRDDYADLMKRGAAMRGETWPPPSDPSFPSVRPIPTAATIYFIGPEHGPIKIGWASLVVSRLRDLRLANAFPLHLWASVEGPPSLERAYHQQFAAHRLHGEWFERCPEIEAEIARLVNSSTARETAK